MNEDGTWTGVWQNQHIDNTLSPRWAETVSVCACLLCELRRRGLGRNMCDCEQIIFAVVSKDVVVSVNCSDLRERLTLPARILYAGAPFF